MPTFCRHNRFVERCPICRETVPGLATPPRGGGRGRSAEGTPSRKPARRSERQNGRGHQAAGGMRVYADGSQRGVDDGYRCDLVPGLRSSEDARRLAAEIGFASGRLFEIATAPSGMYAVARGLGEAGRLERASWICFLIAYLSPLDDGDPFAGIAAMPDYEELLSNNGHPTIDDAALDGNAIDDAALDGNALDAGSDRGSGGAGAAAEGSPGVPLGPRTSHERGRGAKTLQAYLAWAARAGSQRDAFTGEQTWTPERRFQRIFERLALPGLTRAARYELLVLLGRLGLYEMRPDSLHLAAAAAGEPALDAAKRVFGIGDAINLERRAGALAEACGVAIESLDAALYNWGASTRSSLGVDPGTCDERALSRALDALKL